MTDNPFTPPAVELVENPQKPRYGSPAKAIIVGVVVDFTATFVLGAIMIFVFSFVSVVEGVAAKDIPKLIENSDVIKTMGILLGSLSTIVAGYVAARIAGRREIRISAYCGLAVMVIALLLFATGESVDLDLENLALNLSTVPLAMLGGVWRRSRARRK